MAKKKTADTIPAAAEPEKKAGAPRRRAATSKTTAETVVKAGHGSNGSTAADSTPTRVSAPDASPNHRPTYDQIAEAAYLRYLRRGGGDGADFDDWVAAEQELKSR
jgi:hypothetical protein